MRLDEMIGQIAKKDHEKSLIPSRKAKQKKQ
jgi:hypothetical protein